MASVAQQGSSALATLPSPRFASSLYHNYYNYTLTPIHLFSLYTRHKELLKMAIFGSSSGSSGNVDEIKSTIVKQLQQEAAVNNARQLIGVRYTLPLQTRLHP